MGLQERNPKVVEQFKRRRKAQWLMTGLLLLMVGGLLWFQEHSHHLPSQLAGSGMAGVMVVVVICAVTFSFQNWRCPACNRYLGKVMNPQFCSGCGAPLQ